MSSDDERRATIRASQIAKGLRSIEGGRVELPAEERGRSDYDLALLDSINARLVRGYKPRRGETVEQQREADLRAREALEGAMATKAGERAIKEGTAETVGLAQGRGVEVGEYKPGIRRLLDSDPLLSLARTGAMTVKQLEAGQAVSELYDLRMGDAASVAFDGMPAGSHEHERFVVNRYIRAKTTVPVAQLETALLNGHYRTNSGMLRFVRCWEGLREAGLEPHIALKALRWVCCEHNTLTSMGRGRDYYRNRQALCWALDVADEVLDGRSAGQGSAVADPPEAR